MPLISVSLAHGQSLDEARRRLGAVSSEIADRFGIRHVEWSADRSRVTLVGTGARVDIWVDVREVHVTGDIPALAGLLSGPLILGIRQILDEAFLKRLR
jgi:Putative polyhydroxyalkanoic acid system protein (PHA_gran_rgn)